MRHSKNYLNVVGYALFFSLVILFTKPTPFSGFDLVIFYFMLLVCVKEYTSKYFEKSMVIKAHFHKENFKSQLNVLNNLPTGISIVDDKKVFFSTQNMREYLGVRQSNDLMWRTKELKFQK
jgi:hypothetical protein